MFLCLKRGGIKDPLSEIKAVASDTSREVPTGWEGL